MSMGIIKKEWVTPLLLLFLPLKLAKLEYARALPVIVAV
jgi:hypothetical protein